MAATNYEDLYQESYRDIALARVRKNGLEIKNIDKKSIYYEQIVREAIAQNPVAIKHIKRSEPFYNELASLVVRNDPKLIKYVDKKATNYSSLAVQAVNNDAKLLKTIDRKNEIYKSLAYEVATQDPSAKRYVKDKSVKQVIKLDNMDKTKKKGKYEKLAKKAVKKNLEALKHGPSVERDVLDKYIKKNQSQIKHVSKEAAYGLIAHDNNLYNEINSDYKKDKEFMTPIARYSSRYSFDLSKIDPSLLDSEDFILGVVDRNSKIMEHASSRLKDDKKFMLKATEDRHPDYKHEVARYASERLLAEKDFVFQTGTLSFASDNLRSDRKYVLDYMKKKDKTMDVASDSLRNDKDFVLHCINKTTYNYANLAYASDELKNDKDVIRAALKNYKRPYGFLGSVSSHIGQDLRDDKDFMLEIIKGYDNQISAFDASSRLRKDEDFMTQIIKSGRGGQFVNASEELRNNKEFAILAIENGGADQVMKHAGKKVKKDKAILSLAVKKDVYSLRYADPKLLKDKKFILSLLKDVPMSISNYIHPSLFKDKKFLLAAVKENNNFFDEIPREILKDKKFSKKLDAVMEKENEDLVNNDQEGLEAKKEENKKEEKIAKKKNSAKKEKVKKEKGSQEVVTEVQPKEETEVKKEETETKAVVTEVQPKEETEVKKEETLQPAKAKAKSRKAMGNYDDLNDDNKAIYDAIMKKSFTNVFKSMTKEHEEYLKGIYKEAYETIKVKDPKEYTKEDVQVVALLTKLSKKRVQAQEGSKKTNEEMKIMMDDKVKEKKVTSSSR